MGRCRSRGARRRSGGGVGSHRTLSRARCHALLSAPHPPTRRSPLPSRLLRSTHPIHTAPLPPVLPPLPPCDHTQAPHTSIVRSPLLLRPPARTGDWWILTEISSLTGSSYSFLWESRQTKPAKGKSGSAQLGIGGEEWGGGPRAHRQGRGWGALSRCRERRGERSRLLLRRRFGTRHPKACRGRSTSASAIVVLMSVFVGAAYVWLRLKC